MNTEIISMLTCIRSCQDFNLGGVTRGQNKVKQVILLLHTPTHTPTYLLHNFNTHIPINIGIHRKNAAC